MYRHIPFTVITIVIGVLIAGLVFVIGGTLAGLNILSMLVSPTAYLIYVILLALTVWAVFKYFISRDSR